MVFKHRGQDDNQMNSFSEMVSNSHFYICPMTASTEIQLRTLSVDYIYYLNSFFKQTLSGLVNLGLDFLLCYELKRKCLCLQAQPAEGIKSVLLLTSAIRARESLLLQLWPA